FPYTTLFRSELVANDLNDATVDITVTPVTPAPGVTAPSSQTGVTVPFTLSWTGTPSASGSFSYDVTVSDGVSSPTFTVTLTITNPAPTLAPAAGSSFNASRVYSGGTGVALASAVLEANDQNDATVDIT